MAIGPDRRIADRAIGERIVGRDAAILVDADDGAMRDLRVLRLLHVFEALAQRRIERAVAGELKARAEMIGRIAAIGPEDFGHVFQRAAIIAEAAMDDRRTIGRVIALGIGNIDLPVGGKVRVQRDAEIAGLAFRIGWRQAADGRRRAFAAGDIFQAAFLFREQQVAIRQEGHAPRKFGFGDDRGELQFDVAADGRCVFGGAATGGEHESGGEACWVKAHDSPYPCSAMCAEDSLLRLWGQTKRGAARESCPSL